MRAHTRKHPNKHMDKTNPGAVKIVAVRPGTHPTGSELRPRPHLGHCRPASGRHENLSLPLT